MVIPRQLPSDCLPDELSAVPVAWVGYAPVPIKSSTLADATKFMKKSPGNVRGLITANLLQAIKRGPKGGGHYEILKSDCPVYFKGITKSGRDC